MTEKRPNFIFIIADDHRAQSLGSHGSDVATPHLDALAARGLDMTNAHCQGGFNGAVCVPSRATLMTGRSVFDLTPPEERGAPDFSAGAVLPAEFPTMPERLCQHGYRTHAIGKWHNDKAGFARSFSSADRVFFGGMADHYGMVLQDYDPTGCYEESRAQEVPGHSTDVFREAAVQFLEDQGDDPFFLYVAMTAPHDPRTPPDAYKVNPDTISLPPAFAKAHPFDIGSNTIRDELLADMPRNEAAIRQHIADYHGMIAHLDDAIGQILAANASRVENTVVIYTSDHGLSLGNHGLLGKQNLYEHSIGIPLIVAGPGITSAKNANLVWHGDTHRTVLELAGLSSDPDCKDCQNLQTADGAGRTYFSAVYRSTQRMICDSRYKYIRYYKDVNELSPGSDTEQLFDTKADPHEMTNLAAIPDYKDIRDRLASALSDWQVAVGDTRVEGVL